MCWSQCLQVAEATEYGYVYRGNSENCDVSDEGVESLLALHQLQELRLCNYPIAFNSFTINGFEQVMRSMENRTELAVLEMYLP